MTARDIADTLQELYGTEVSPAMVAKVTDAVWDTVPAWQSRPLEAVYPILHLDGLVIEAHQDNRVLNKTLHVALGVNLAGHKEDPGRALGWQVSVAEPVVAPALGTRDHRV